jgi:hypothetical protein
MAEVDLATRFVAGINPFCGLKKKRPEFIVRDDFDSVPGNTFVCVHQK